MGRDVADDREERGDREFGSRLDGRSRKKKDVKVAERRVIEAGDGVERAESNFAERFGRIGRHRGAWRRKVSVVVGLKQVSQRRQELE